MLGWIKYGVSGDSGKAELVEFVGFTEDGHHRHVGSTRFACQSWKTVAGVRGWCALFIGMLVFLLFFCCWAAWFLLIFGVPWFLFLLAAEDNVVFLPIWRALRDLMFPLKGMFLLRFQILQLGRTVLYPKPT